MTDIMLDLETLDTKPTSVILTIGAIRFNREKRLLPLKECDVFYRKIEIEKQKDEGFTSSQLTENWWNRQDEDVREEALGDKEYNKLEKGPGGDRRIVDEKKVKFNKLVQDVNRGDLPILELGSEARGTTTNIKQYLTANNKKRFDKLYLNGSI